jgi:cytochrome c biogenesis protein CcdA
MKFVVNIEGLYASGTLPLFMLRLLRLWLTELALFVLPGSIIGAGIYWVLGRWYPSLFLSYVAAIACLHYAAQHNHLTLSLMGLLGYSLGLTLPPIVVAVSTGYFVFKQFRIRARKIETP